MNYYLGDMTGDDYGLSHAKKLIFLFSFLKYSVSDFITNSSGSAASYLQYFADTKHQDTL